MQTPALQVQTVYILEYTTQTANVSAFSDIYEELSDVPIVTAATAYDDPITGTTTILIIGQALFLGEKVSNTLLCPNQLRQNGIIVDDVPTHLAPVGRPSTHAIHVPDEGTIIPLKLRGVISHFNSRTPTQQEIDTCRWITITNEHNWDPHSSAFQEAEESYTQLQDQTEYKDRNIFSLHRSSDFIHENDMSQISSAFDNHFLHTYMI